MRTLTEAEGIKTEAEVALYGGTAGAQYDPCYHLACDTFDNISLKAPDATSDAAAHATMNHAMSTAAINGAKGKGTFSADKQNKDAAMASFLYRGNKLQK